MNKLPNAVKWLIVLAVLGAMGVLMWKVNCLLYTSDAADE